MTKMKHGQDEMGTVKVSFRQGEGKLTVEYSWSDEQIPSREITAACRVAQQKVRVYLNLLSRIKKCIQELDKQEGWLRHYRTALEELEASG